MVTKTYDYTNLTGRAQFLVTETTNQIQIEFRTLAGNKNLYYSDTSWLILGTLSFESGYFCSFPSPSCHILSEMKENLFTHLFSKTPFKNSYCVVDWPLGNEQFL